MSSSTSPLPPPSANQAYVTVSPIAGGFITLSDQHFVSPADPQAKRTVPSLTFLITHPNPSRTSIPRYFPQATDQNEKKPIHIMFDLGLRKSPSRYPKVLQTHLIGRKPYELSPGVAAQLQSGGLDPKDIDLVILSHVHYDHHGDPEDFPRAQFVVGHGAVNVLKHGLGGMGSHQHFDPEILPADRMTELPDPDDRSCSTESEWKALGPFPSTLDLFHDGSLYLISTPGHLPGHLNLLCRTAPSHWILLCGDAYHDRRLLTGEKDIGTWEDAMGRVLCIHVDKKRAAESIQRLREFDAMTGEQCELIAAHEDEWWERNKGRAFPGTI